MIDENLDDTAEFPAFKKQREESISARTAVDVGALSHTGKLRATNQDSFLVMRIGREIETLLTNLPAGNFTDHHSEVAYGMLVADGVGGSAGGEVASRTAISALLDLAIQTPDWIFNVDDEGAQAIMSRRKERFDRLREALDESEALDPDLAGMATTMTAAVSLGANLIISHVGDSRAYLFTHGQLVRLTKDQTMAQLLADLGVISPEEVDRHYARHVLTAAIKAEGQKADVELHHIRLASGDRLLLCSDGLTEMVSDDDIAAILKRPAPASESCQALIDAALAAGGTDNVTVVLASYQIPEDFTRRR